MPETLHTQTGPVGKWQIRILSPEPWLIEDSEVMYVQTLREVMGRCYTIVRRTSYMVGQPNREVMWAIDRWNHGRKEWQAIINGKSRLAKGAMPS